jgi:uncharacterized membrane protein YcaP (DUF421 family)
MFDISWKNMLTLSLPVLEKIVRPIIVYAFLIVGLRIAGKRGLASLNSFDLVVLLCISNTVQNAIIGEDNSVTGGLIGAATLLAINYIVVRFFFEHPKLDELVEGSATMLIDKGALIEANLHKELITHAELLAAAHRQGFASLDDVDSCELEPGGALSFIARKPTPDEKRDVEILKRLDALAAQLAELKEKVERGQGPGVRGQN